MNHARHHPRQALAVGIEAVAGGVGHCEPPDKPDKAIFLSPAIKTPEGLIEIALRGILHAAQWDLDETAVEEIARDMARILIRMGVTADVAKVHEKLRLTRGQAGA